MDPIRLIRNWQALGETRSLSGHEIFVVDVPADDEQGKPPLLILHGFPTSSIDYAATLPALRRQRRVVVFDMLGYGLSAKPDRRYSLFDQADLVSEVAGDLGLDRVDLLTHDMGDSVGGEVLARSIDGALRFEIERRVITNGSIYIGMAVFTDGQKMLLDLPDEKLDGNLGFDPSGVTEGLRATLAEAPLDDAREAHLRAAAELVCHDEGVEILPRLIRYIAERREHEGRWTAAIENHPSPLRIVWGDQDPVAIFAMAEQLHTRRPDAAFVRLDDLGHYPMIESPARFVDAVLPGMS